MAEIIDTQIGISKIHNAIAAIQGKEVAKFVTAKVTEALDKATKTSTEDVEKIQARINALSKLMDGDTDDEYSAENLIGFVSDINKVANENATDIDNLEERIEQSDEATNKMDKALRELITKEDLSRREAISEVKKEIVDATTMSSAQIQATGNAFQAALWGSKSSVSAVGAEV